MVRTKLHKIKWSYRKNIFELKGLLFRQYPNFILSRNPRTLGEYIPVFVFHFVQEELFTEQLDFLSANGYQTLNAMGLYDILLKGKPVPENAVVLTFDDGWGSVWTVAYPLLKKYGFQAICFLIPGLIRENALNYPNLDDIWAGYATIADIEKREDSEIPLATWDEIITMHESGLVDFQAHSMYHHLIVTSPTVVDFIHPNYDYYRFGNAHVPVYRTKGKETFARVAPLGMPVYESDPRYYFKRRYFDNEDLRNACVEFVNKNGGQEFFEQKDWRKTLYRCYLREKKRLHYDGFYESSEDQAEAILTDLQDAKAEIERRLDGKKVNHLCYPWFLGSTMAIEMSKKAGYLTNFWGTLFAQQSNTPGSDPYLVSIREG